MCDNCIARVLQNGCTLAYVKGFMNFEQALAEIKAGKKVGRKEWKNARFVFLVDGSKFNVNRAPLNKMFAEGTEITYRPHIDMCGADDTIGTWSPSMVDILAEDWYVIE